MRYPVAALSMSSWNLHRFGNSRGLRHWTRGNNISALQYHHRRRHHHRRARDSDHLEVCSLPKVPIRHRPGPPPRPIPADPPRRPTRCCWFVPPLPSSLSRESPPPVMGVPLFPDGLLFDSHELPRWRMVQHVLGGHQSAALATSRPAHPVLRRQSKWRSARHTPLSLATSVGGVVAAAMFVATRSESNGCPRAHSVYSDEIPACVDATWRTGEPKHRLRTHNRDTEWSVQFLRRPLVCRPLPDEAQRTACRIRNPVGGVAMVVMILLLRFPLSGTTAASDVASRPRRPRLF